ncbi:aldehyde dehydrogenase [Thermosulfidibacter takaii ABI70S6]|uniref:Aldehyde dehydrogenase n=1 Tax=Thermosulfidibacter takaii (strain DSM 17441 / JCM 13301 / NBRC 103674 / ABI70S6) TaxID=1298851 RepID=A0A0S3QU83_THET7|nr:aldehyde dehydrogenase family protein [Thermosulfidibacter takaii]BAT71882.1 aldehyde dehydrogenase [Thermosulfidibacter takaii ABI70S6]
MEISKRVKLLRTVGERIERRKEDIVRGFAEDIGVAVKIGSAEVDMTVDYLKTMDEEVPWVEGRKPYGVVGGVLPYDASTMMFARLAGSAVLGSNRAYVSFSSLTPSTKEILLEELKDFKDWIRINEGSDNREFSKRCCDDPDVRLFYISGGDEVGRLFAQRIHCFDKIIFAGPSGMPPCIVWDGYDVEKAARFVAKRAFLNGGQYCTTIKRVYVKKDLMDDFMHYLLEGVDRIKVGDPLDPEVDYGPIKAKRTRVLIDRALKKVKGKRIRGRVEGEWITPIVILAEEIPDLELFGPLLAVQFVETEDEAFDRALDTRFRHIVYIFGDISERNRKRILDGFGMVHFNPEFTFLPLRGPYGGKMDAGWVLEKVDGEVVKKDGPIIYCVEMTRPA